MDQSIFNQKTIRYHLRDEVDASIRNEIFQFREYRQTETIIKKATGAIVDIGAHAGFFSLYAAALNPAVKIYALEPETNNFQALSQNVKLNPDFNNIRIFNLALGTSTGTQTLYLSADSHNHSFLPAGRQAKSELPVPTISLQDFCARQKITRISLLKMDIEGGEHEIIKNWTPAELALIDQLFLEVHETATDFYQSLEKVLRTSGWSVQIFPCQFAPNLKFILANNKKKLKSPTLLT